MPIVEPWRAYAPTPSFWARSSAPWWRSEEQSIPAPGTKLASRPDRSSRKLTVGSWSSVTSRLQDRERVDRRARATGDPQRGRQAQKLPSPCRLTCGCQVLELQVVE